MPCLCFLTSHFLLPPGSPSTSHIPLPMSNGHGSVFTILDLLTNLALPPNTILPETVSISKCKYTRYAVPTTFPTSMAPPWPATILGSVSTLAPTVLSALSRQRGPVKPQSDPSLLCLDPSQGSHLSRIRAKLLTSWNTPSPDTPRSQPQPPFGLCLNVTSSERCSSSTLFKIATCRLSLHMALIFSLSTYCHLFLKAFLLVCELQEGRDHACFVHCWLPQGLE